MPRINPVTPEATPAKSTPLLEGVQKALGVTPNMMKTMAHSPAVLGAYLGFGQALGGSSLSGTLREQIALAVAGANTCDYCASAHTALGKGLGVSEDELTRNLEGRSDDARTDAALKFATAVVAKRGFVSDDDLSAVRQAGYGDAELTELIATVVLNIFTNYFNHIAQTDIDFPLVNTQETVAA
jgi:uncharacterized peroxidase-related enzyme